MPTKTATKKKTTKRRTSAVASSDAEDFGDGLIDGEAAPKKRKAAKKKSAKKRTKAAKAEKADDLDEEAAAESKPKKRAAKKRKPAARKKSSNADSDVISTGGRDSVGRTDHDVDFVDDEEETPRLRRKSRGGSSKSTESKPKKKKSDDDGMSAASYGGRGDEDEFDFDFDDDEPVPGRRRSSRKSSRRKDSDDSPKQADQTETESEQSDSGRGDSDRGESERVDSERSDSDGEGGRRRGRRGRRGRGRNRENDGNSRGRNDRGNSNNNRGRNQSNRNRDRRTVDPVSDTVEGVLELHPKGYGFVRDRSNDYAAQETDPFVSGQMIDKFGLREGVLLTGEVGPGHRGQGPRLKSVDSIEGNDPEHYLDVPEFDNLTPINPEEQIKLETGPSPITMRVLDLLCPIGKGQRALIVAPPRSGKTILMQQIADSVAHNHPECHLMVLLIDERPEEVTDMRRSVKGEVVASSIDRELENHVRISQLVLERTKRLAEMGKDVFLLMDSITRTARAFNKWTNTGRTGTGGLDVRAMDVPKKLFATARMFDEGGSVTVVGTALIQTGSHMDEAIFQEFKGTGNMELVLSRDLADRRIWPAMDISKSGTRREEKLIKPEMLEGITAMRRALVSLSPADAMMELINYLSKFPTNEEFVSKIKTVL